MYNIYTKGHMEENLSNLLSLMKKGGLTSIKTRLALVDQINQYFPVSAIRF